MNWFSRLNGQTQILISGLLGLAALTASRAAFAADPPIIPPADSSAPAPGATPLRADDNAAAPPANQPVPLEKGDAEKPAKNTDDKSAADAKEKSTDSGFGVVLDAGHIKPGCPPDSIEERCRSFGPDAKLHFDPGLTIYAQYALALRDEAGKTKWFHEFELTRAHAWLGVTYGDAHARILLEAVRSASEGALLGVGGDSFVMRVREAYIGYRLFNYVDIRGGLLPTLTIPVLERSWGMRAVNPSAIERAGFASPADLGATIVGSLPKGFGWIGVGGYNGEGYNRPELNRGKNVEVAAEIHPIAVVTKAQPLAVFGSYMSGSSGTGSARANRINVGAAWQGDVLRGGAAFSYALGVGEDGAESAYAVDTFLKLTLIERLMLGGDFTYWKRDKDKADDQVVLITGTVGVRIVRPFATYFAFDKQIFGKVAKAALPDEDSYRFRLIAALELQ